MAATTRSTAPHEVAPLLDSNGDDLVDAKDAAVDLVQVGTQSALKIDLGVAIGDCRETLALAVLP